MFNSALGKLLRGSLVLSLFSGNVGATDEAAIARCAEYLSPDKRILCLEDFIRSSSPESTEQPPTKSPLPAAATSNADSAADSGHASPDVVPAMINTADIASFGLDKIEEEQQSLSSVDLRVVEVSSNAYGKSIFRTEDGQEWLQTDTRSVRYRNLPVEVTVRKGSSGSFFMQPKTGGVATRVRRRR